MDYVIWDFRGQSDGRPTRCSATRSCLVKVFRLNGRPYCYCYSSVSFSLLRSSVSNGRPYCYSSVSFSLLLLLFLFLTRFLQNVWTDLHEIFRDSVYWSRKTENNFSCDDVTSGRRYWRFSDFEVVILCTKDLQNDSRYLLQIFMKDRRRTEVYPYCVSSL